MERSSVHIAVLVVAEDPATVDLASATFLADKLSGAGHRVVAQEIVEHQEAAIRDQLARWIGQGHIDVIVAAGAGDAAAAALGPLVTRPIAGLTDQLRLLARDRGSADKPVAARASSKLVFLLPPEIGALGATLNQLVLPQLDSTTERNLVGELPRLKPVEAVPQTIAAEKTVTGAGVAPKLPATREKRTTANVISRKGTALEDPTKPVEIEARGRAKTPVGAHDAPTRPHIDLASMLPPVPPGADDSDTPDDAPLLDGPTSVTVQPRARDSIGTAKPAPGNNDVTKIAPAPTRIPTPMAGVAKIAPTAAEPVTPLPSLKPPRQFAETIKPANRPIAQIPSIKPVGDAKPPGLRLPAPTPVSGTTTAGAAANAVTPVAGLPSITGKGAPAATGDAARRGRTTQPSPAPPVASSPIDQVRPADLEAAAAEEAIDAASSADIIEASAADFEEAATPPPTPRAASGSAPPPRPVTGPAPVVPTRPATGPAPVVPPPPANGVAVRPPTGPAPVVPPRPAGTGLAPVVPTRPATGPAPVVPKRPPTGPVAVAPAVATSAAQMPPLTQPELLDLREGTQKKRRARTGTAIVRPSSRAPILMYLALAAAAVAGFLVVVHVLPRATHKSASVDPPAPPPVTSAVVPSGSAVGSAEAPVEPAGSAVEAAGSGVEAAGSAQQVAEAGSNDIDLEPPPAHGTVHAAVPATHATARPTHAPAAHVPATHAPAAGTAAAPAEVKPAAEPPADDGCDEVSCIMEKYARACCAKYKPSEEAFHPKGAVPDALDKSMVKAGMEKVKPKVVSCGEKSSAKGTVKLAITVGPEGNISEISVADSPDGALGECVLAAVKRATFGKSVNGASFTYPFAF